MNRLLRLSLMIMTLLGCYINLFGQNYTIEKWYNGKKSATTLTFDDWSPGHGPIVVPALKNKGLIGTFFVTVDNSSFGGGYAQMKVALDNGNEIGNHTKTHRNLSTLTAAELVQEISDVKTTLESNIPGAKVVSFCYPRGDYNDNVINEAKKRHISARAFVEPVPADIQFPYNFASTNRDYYTVNTVPVDANMTTAMFASRIQQAIASKGYLTFTIHSVNNASVSDSWWDPITETQLNQFFDELNNYKNQTWITTYGNAIKYHKEAGSAVLSTVSNNSDEWNLSLTDTLSANTIFNHPLTIKLKKVAGELYSSITQNGANISFTTTAGNDSIIFNAIPDGGNIKIVKGGITLTVNSPTNGATFTGLSPISLSANATITGATISNVTYNLNGQNIVVTSGNPYTASWTPTAYGTYNITVSALASNGKTAQSIINITVNPVQTCTAPAWVAATAYSTGAEVSYNGKKYKANWWTQNEQPDTHSGSGQVWLDEGTCGSGNASPSVSITSPANNSTFTSPATITINVNATDSDGSISKVEFYNGTTKLGEDLASPYSYTWSNVVAGNYSIIAKAYDNLNAVTTSSAVSITGSNGNIAPQVSITSPANNSTFTSPATITINVNATDSDGTISKVEFYNGTTKLGEDLTSPYSYTWNNVVAGNYSITAKAYDNLNAVTTSSAVNISGGNGNSAPQVSITSPANNAGFNAPATITINASATDSDGSISKVEFYNGSTKLGEDLTSPYTYTWSNVATGTYSVTAKAFDNLNLSTTSTTVTVNVSASGTCTAAQYVENGGYVAGSRVKNNDILYECKPYPYTGWCNGAAFAYAPGTGSNWQDAWTSLGTCTAKMAYTTSESVGLKVYPNPTDGKVLLTLNAELGNNVSIKVLNSMGIELLTVRTNGDENYLLDITSLPSGIYTMEIVSDETRLIERVVKK